MEFSYGKVIYSAGKRLRFEDSLHNFRKALEKYANVVERKEEFYNGGFGDTYLDLVVKRFEFTYEMSWKAMRLPGSRLAISTSRKVKKETPV